MKMLPPLLLLGELFAAVPQSTAPTPGTLLLGGGKDLDAAFQWFTGKAGSGDVVVLRSSGTDAYNSYIAKLGAVRSVETLLIDTPERARDSHVINQIRNASAVFIAGGDQGQYAKLWKYSPVASAIDFAASRGVPIGGTSAGLAILGGLAFTARHDSITSEEALRNPYDPRITIENGFLTIPYLGGILFDSHFTERSRMGRLQVFLARAMQDQLVSEARGIGIDEQTALTVDGDGVGRVLGKGSVYFLRSAAMPEICKPDTPLRFSTLHSLQLRAGSRFDLKAWTVIN